MKNMGVRAAFHKRLKLEVSQWGDDAGMFLSALCAVHCLVTPLAVALFPALFGAHDENDFHLVMLGLLSFIAIFSLFRGTKVHGQKNVVALGLVGLTFLALGVAAFEMTHNWIWGSGVSTIGSFFLISAHYLNRKYCKCYCCCAA